MSKRFRWYKIHIPIDLNCFFESLDKMKFDNDSELGFVHLSNADGEKKYRFFCQKTMQIKSVDTEGNEYFNDVITLKYLDVCFIRRNEHTILRIEDPSQAIREFFDTLEKLTGFGFYAVDCKFSYDTFANLLSSFLDVSLLGIKASGIVPSEGVVAKIELVSKSPLQIAEVDLIKRYRYNVDAADFYIRHLGRTAKVSFSKSGLVKISGELTLDIIKCIDDFSCSDPSVKF